MSFLSGSASFSVFLFGFDHHIADDKGLNAVLIDALFIFRGQAIINQNRGFGIDGNVHFTVREGSAYIFGVFFVEIG